MPLQEAPSRIEQARLGEDGKSQPGRGGRGGRGQATGRGRGRGAKAHAATDLATPSPKANKAMGADEAKDLETPEKESKPPAKKPKTPKPKSSGKPKPVKAAAETPSKGKTAETSSKGKTASGEPRKRRRIENFEERSFARRPRPTGENPGLQWQSIRDVFFEKIHTQLPKPSAHQDGIMLQYFPGI